ncbi:MAG TPA: cyclic nucleotide-binding domain-containing protein [Stellaceae bacterium]|nr:cyclic nucleotide-binding domain-containing protein [Stellaceae bacterium]
MAADFKVAIVGSGPAGLSAAAHAAKLGVAHVLFERTPHLNDTIFKYQKRKHVMATPEVLPLRSDLEFREESREEIIESWTKNVESAALNVRLGTEVNAIKGQKGEFTLTLSTGETVSAENVVLAIGVQGNLNRLRLPGADLPFVQYQLDDPDEYKGEEIAVIGTGDAGLENALALAVNNNVSVINRVADFPRAKAGNVALIEAAIKSGDIHHLANCEPRSIEPGYLVCDTADGAGIRLRCDRIIARIGALPPRRFVESCGVVFPNDSPTAYPAVSETYESQIPGLYIVGALAGYPLIKHCLNQGYEVVEYILGNPIPPADEPLIQAKLDAAQVKMTVPELVAAVRERLPLFSALTTLQVREFLIHSEIHHPAASDIVFKRGEFANSLYTILDGEVGIQVNPEDPSEMVRLRRGEFFGEMALISGRRRTSTVVATSEALLLEIDRNTMVKLVRSEPTIKAGIDKAAVIREIKTFLMPQVEDDVLADVVDSSVVVEFKPDEKLIEEDAEDDSVYLIRKGSVTVSMRVGGKDVVLAYLPAGNYVGEMALVTHRHRAATVTAASATEAIRMDSAAFRALLDRDPELRRKVEDKLQHRMMERNQLSQNAETGDLIKFLVRQGLGEATDVLLIDESLCVRCDNCEKACAETHNGVSRLNREAGPTFAMLHVPTSCRHCEDPHCMADCPPDAIHRAPNGEVYITDQCIGCGNCERNCPYGVIQMAAVPEKKPGIWSWLFLGRGPGPGEDKSPEGLARRTGGKHAVKCDMCKGIDGGPACVRACPTGAAIRVDPAGFIDVMRRAEA